MVCGKEQQFFFLLLSFLVNPLDFSRFIYILEIKTNHCFSIDHATFASLMSRRPLPAISSPTNTMMSINRMTILMSISEITPQIFISGRVILQIEFVDISHSVLGQMAATLEEVQKLGITYILVSFVRNLFFQSYSLNFPLEKNVAVESSAIVYPKTIKLEKYDIIDFPTAPISNYFNSLTDKIHAHLNANKQHKVLVHCMAGISRSKSLSSFSLSLVFFCLSFVLRTIVLIFLGTTIVCAYLVRYMNMTLRDAYLLCKSKRPICFPNLGFWNQLIAYENQLRQENSVKSKID